MNNKFNENLPKIGIRPTIDGRRRGVRESMEEKTMGMAKALEALLVENLRYPNGEKVECVIADTTIGGVAEASRCADKFSKAGVGLTITVTPCWCYGSETIDMDPLMPKAIWGFNGTEKPGAVYLAAALAGHSQKGLPAFGIYGQDVQDSDDNEVPEDVKSKLLQFAKAGVAAAIMKGKSYLSIGSVAMGIAGSIVDSSFFQKYLGMRNEYVDMTEITRRIEEEIYDTQEFEKALAWEKEGFSLEFEEIVQLAKVEKSGVSFIDPDNELFYDPGNMPSKVKQYCKNTNQPVPESIGEIIRCIEGSLDNYLIRLRDTGKVLTFTCVLLTSLLKSLKQADFLSL